MLRAPSILQENEECDLRRSNIDASAGSRKEIERIVGHIRASWPEVKIILRGDYGFCREDLMAWCEASGVDYVETVSPSGCTSRSPGRRGSSLTRLRERGLSVATRQAAARRPPAPRPR